MRPRQFSQVAYTVVAIEIALVIALVLVFTVPSVTAFLRGGTTIAWIALFGLGLVAWWIGALVRKKVGWGRKPPVPKPKLQKTSRERARAAAAKQAAAQRGAMAPAPAAGPSLAAVPPPDSTASKREKASLIKDARVIAENTIEYARFGVGLAKTFFGTKAITSAALSFGAQLGVPSGTVMFFLNIAGIEDRAAEQARRVDELRSISHQAALRLETLAARLDKADEQIGRLDRLSYHDDGRISVLEKVVGRNEGSRVHVEIVDRRSPAPAASCTTCANLDISDLLGRATSASAKYWKGQYCAAALDLADITRPITDLPASVANLKGNWLWRVSDYVGAERCFAYSLAASSRAKPGDGRGPFGSGLMGLAQTFCMRRNHPDVYSSGEFEALRRQYASRGIDAAKEGDDSTFAAAVLRYGIDRDPGLPAMLRKELESGTEFARLCVGPIKMALKAGFTVNSRFAALIDGIIDNARQRPQECREHRPLNCAPDSQ